MIRKCSEDDFQATLAIINDGAEAYRGIIPDDRWTDPYMSEQKPARTHTLTCGCAP
jgi:hypothetical protein